MGGEFQSSADANFHSRLSPCWARLVEELGLSFPRLSRTNKPIDRDSIACKTKRLEVRSPEQYPSIVGRLNNVVYLLASFYSQLSSQLSRTHQGNVHRCSWRLLTPWTPRVGNWFFPTSLQKHQPPVFSVMVLRKNNFQTDDLNR